jgi:hypothetical protein
MSYVVQIWENPQDISLPASIDAALQILETLQSCQLNEFNQKFIALAKRLKQRYPDMDSMSFDEDEDDDFDFSELAWTDLRINGETLDAVYGLGINVNDLFEEVRPFVMQEATALGLCVLDEQAGEVYLPGGKVLKKSDKAKPISASKKSQPQEDEDPPRNKKLLAIAFERLTPLMIEHGYKAYKGKRLFKRIFAEGWCELELWSEANMWPLHGEFEIQSRLRCHAITDLIKEIAYPHYSTKDTDEWCTFILRPEKWLETNDEFGVRHGAYTVKRYEQIEATIANLVMKVQTCLLPAMASCQTLADFEYHLNTPEGQNSIFNLHKWDYPEPKVIAAYLVGNPVLENLCELYTSFAEKNNNKELLKCIDYVQSHPCPSAINK